MLSLKIARALVTIKKAVKYSGDMPLILNFSGGRDSSCIMLLARQVTDKIECLYMKSGMDLPGSIEFVERQCRRFGFKLHISDPVRDYFGDFAYWVRRRGYFPTVEHNYCMVVLKLRPARRYLRRIFWGYPLYKLTGIRREESTRRLWKYLPGQYIQPDGEHSRSFMVHPILDWTDQDVDDYLRLEKFEINENYKPFGVSGCYWCPFYGWDIYLKILRVYPNIYDGIIKLEEELGKPSVVGRRFLRDIKARSQCLEVQAALKCSHPFS